MRVVIQRVTSSQVVVDDKIIGAIGRGLNLLVGIADTEHKAFVAKLRQSGLRVETGQFGAMMQVSIENDGPVTLLMEQETI